MLSRYIGQDIGGYRIIEPIGRGGMARSFAMLYLSKAHHQP